jgi:N-acetylglutamate synthase-like GNAT family acetyltransferase/uncharacterized damage-inducible protein DinB
MEIKIINYTKENQKYFELLNKSWVEKYFKIEPMDEMLLSNPEDTILKNGGKIFFIEHQNQLIGTVALIFICTGIYELAKMTVREDFRGLGAGKFLCNAAIEEAKKLNADKLVLFTNSKLKNAIAVYHKFGFKEVPLGGQEYSRANIKMELSLKPQTNIKWFDRQFNFGFNAEHFPDLLERLNTAVFRIQNAVAETNDEKMNYKPSGKWSAKEHIGHLLILEPLWQRRFLEIKENRTEMSPADLNNAATDKALFNEYDIEKILTDFKQERQNTIQLLKSFSREDLQKSLYHPRLNKPMTIIDLMYFVAEHDTHHLNVLRHIINNYQQH